MSNAKNKNYMLLKAILSDGFYTSEDFLMVECQTDIPTPTPSPTKFSLPSPTPTPTPTQTPSDKIELILSNNWTYRINGFLIAKFIPVNNQISYVIRIPPLSSGYISRIGEKEWYEDKEPLPLSSSVLVGSEKIGDLLFVTEYINKNITLLVNANTYTSTINIGQIIF